MVALTGSKTFNMLKQCYLIDFAYAPSFQDDGVFCRTSALDDMARTRYTRNQARSPQSQKHFGVNEAMSEMGYRKFVPRNKTNIRVIFYVHSGTVIMPRRIAIVTAFVRSLTFSF